MDWPRLALILTKKSSLIIRSSAPQVSTAKVLFKDLIPTGTYELNLFCSHPAGEQQPKKLSAIQIIKSIQLSERQIKT
jgi:hypothetical protein